jgi:N-acetylglucosaminyldiphosphoundecaprenol N-acetyl-beta-D-mannosaminyltransferase
LNIEKVINVLDCPCTIADKTFYRDVIQNGLGNGTSIITVAINARKIVMFNQNPEFRALFEQNTVLPVPDGIGATVPMRLFNKKVSEKIDFPGFMFEFCNTNGIKCYFLGATESTNEKAVAQIAKMYPGITITGRHCGFDIDEEKILADLFRTQTQVVFIAMGSPKQEFLSSRLSKKSTGIVFVGVGGRFDILANEKKRAPKFLIKCGLEWSYRFISEPYRIRYQKNDILAYLDLFIRRIFTRPQ